MEHFCGDCFGVWQLTSDAVPQRRRGTQNTLREEVEKAATSRALSEIPSTGRKGR